MPITRAAISRAPSPQCHRLPSTCRADPSSTWIQYCHVLIVCTACDDVTELSAHVSGSIEYPVNGVYAANMNCLWRLHAPHGMVSPIKRRIVHRASAAEVTLLLEWYLAIEAWSLTQWYLERAGVRGGGGVLFTAGTACTQAWSIVECELSRVHTLRSPPNGRCLLQSSYHSVFSAEGATYHSIIWSLLASVLFVCTSPDTPSGWKTGRRISMKFLRRRKNWLTFAISPNRSLEPDHQITVLGVVLPLAKLYMRSVECLLVFSSANHLSTWTEDELYWQLQEEKLDQFIVLFVMLHVCFDMLTVILSRTCLFWIAFGLIFR